jgi:hypothetical protein
MNPTRLFSGVLVAMALALGTGACSAAPDAAADDVTADELRAPTKGDVDQVLLDAVAADATPPEGLRDVKSWSVHYVQLRDPKNPANPDPLDAFNGFFLIAKDATGTPLFFDTIALMDDGLAHFYFSVKTDEAGNYFEMPLMASSTDPAAVARVEKKVSWLAAEKTRLGHLIESRYATAAAGTAAATIHPMDTKAQQWTAGAECAADLAVLALTAASPITMLVAQAAVDGTFALVDAVSGSDGAQTNLENAATDVTMAGVAKGVGKAVTHAVTKGVVSGKTVGTLKSAGGPLVLVAMVGVVGYQMYEHGAKAGLKAAVNLLIPDACVKTYKNLTQLPHNDVTKP